MRIRETSALATLLISAFVLVGCGGLGGLASRAEPAPGDPWLGAKCQDAEIIPPGIGDVGVDGEILISVGSFGLWSQELIPQSLIIYADGSVVSLNYDQNAALTPSTAGYLPQCALTQAKLDIAALADVNFGTPEITDQEFLSVNLTDPTGVDVELSIYALSYDEDLNQEQQNNRTRLKALLAGLRDSVVELGPLPTDRILIHARDSSEYGAVGSAGEPWLAWDARPLSQIMDGDTCAIIDGEEAHRIADQLADISSIDVLDPDSDLIIEMAQLPPGVDGCR